MEDKLNQLKTLLGEISDINQAIAVLGWDLQVFMPPGGNEARGYQMGTLMRISHTKSTSDEIGRLLQELQPYVGQLDADADDARLVKVTRRNYDKETHVPAAFVEELARVTTSALDAWQRAKVSSDFSIFQPHLEKIVDLRRQYANMFTPYAHIYDPLLDDFEPGLKTADIQPIFNTLRQAQVALIKAIGERPQVDDSFLHRAYPEQAQWDFGVEVISRFGYDWQRGRQDRSAHPFTTSFGPGDVRITTRFDPDHSASSLFSSMHESGHAMYEQGFAPKYQRTPLASAASMAVHESQSRMWENLVGRSLPFWKYFYPRLQAYFPTQLANVDLKTFYRGINKVEPSFIRTESDEATYNLHIMLRMEIEIALMEGSLQVRDLPDFWNQSMQEFFGIVPPNDALGVLQDIHWSGASFGYFPTYALGNLIAAQLWERINQQIPDLDDQISRGEFHSLLDWLRTNIHQYGAKYEPQEFVKRVTGSKIDPNPYLRYLNKKYGEIYSL
jgi:carboxypeptidase Taq